MKKTFCFDLDGTLCSLTFGEYELAEPRMSRIEHVNRLVADGNDIKIFTARGASTGVNWRQTTERQLSEWGLGRHTLILGKPHADLFVDDKAVNSEMYDWI